MSRKFIAAFAVPSIAVLAVGIGAALASGAGVKDRAAYRADVETLSASDARAHAQDTFARADMNGSGDLDADEYASLTMVTAELAHVNGFIPIVRDGEPYRVTLPINAPSALVGGERARVDAVARNEFYAIAGDDGRIAQDEFLAEMGARFAAADRNRNGELAKTELVSFAVRQALVSRSSA